MPLPLWVTGLSTALGVVSSGMSIASGIYGAVAGPVNYSNRSGSYDEEIPTIYADGQEFALADPRGRTYYQGLFQHMNQRWSSQPSSYVARNAKQMVDSYTRSYDQRMGTILRNAPTTPNTGE